MRLHEVDGRSHVHTAGESDGDWLDIETRRRTFWLAFIIDRLTSALDNLPLTLDERQIETRLPAPEVHFANGRPTTMHFLPEVLNGLGTGWPNDTVTSFTESILVAAIGGRTLECKQRPLRTIDRRSDWGTSTSDLYRQNAFLDLLLTQHIQTLTARVLATVEQPDPIIIFVSLVAYMAVFMMCETMETTTAGLHGQGQTTQVANDLLVEHKQRSLDATYQLRVLIALLAQINHFQAHPFTPIPLLLGGRFCLAHSGLNDAFGSLLPDIVKALQALKEFNGLAQTCLQLLTMKASQMQEDGQQNG
jgi:hypothetical protein